MCFAHQGTKGKRGNGNRRFSERHSKIIMEHRRGGMWLGRIPPEPGFLKKNYGSFHLSVYRST